MLLIKLTQILYNLKNFRAFVLNLSTNKSNNVLIANNTLTFSLSKKDIKNTNKHYKYDNIIFSFANLKYLDDTYQDLNIKYPTPIVLGKSNSNLFSSIFMILNNQKKKIQLSGIIVKRQKKTFNIRILGLLGKMNIFSLFTNFTMLWNKKDYINYNFLIKLMLSWLQNIIHVNVNLLYLKIFFKIKNSKHKNKKNMHIKQMFTTKPLLLFTCNHIN